MAGLLSFALLTNYGGADQLFNDPAPIPIDFINRLKKEGAAESQQAVNASMASVNAKAAAIGRLVAKPGFLRGPATQDLPALRTQLKELLAEQQKLNGANVSFRSSRDGKSRQQELDSTLRDPLIKRIDTLKDILFKLERADITSDQARELYQTRLESSPVRQVYYDPTPRLGVDLQPNWQRIDAAGLEKELVRQKAELDAGRRTIPVAPTEANKSNKAF